MTRKRQPVEMPRVARIWQELDGDTTVEDVLDDERRPRPMRQIVGFQVGTVGPT